MSRDRTSGVRDKLRSDECSKDPSEVYQLLLAGTMAREQHPEINQNTLSRFVTQSGHRGPINDVWTIVQLQKSLAWV
jgi:hypothetical protein